MVQGDKLIYGYNDRENALLCSYVRKYGENSEEERIIARCEQGGIIIAPAERQQRSFLPINRQKKRKRKLLIAFFFFY